MTIYAAVTGNISEPELKFTAAGKAVLALSIAVNHSRKNRQTDAFEDIGTTWIRATLWEDHAEAAAEQLTKGQRVTARGRLETREFTDREGNKGKSFEMQVDDIGPAVPKRRPQGQRPAQPAQQSQQSAWGQHDAWSGQPPGGGWGNPSESPF